MNYLQASPTEFRIRYWTHALVFGLGFWSPWNQLFSTVKQSSWLTLSSTIARNTTVTFTTATVALLLFGILCGTSAAALRTWATACLGSFTVTNANMQAAHVVAEGPYRHVRNPLYIGIFLHSLALSLLMPPSGALFTVIAIAIMQARLIAGEEPFLTRSLGHAYTAYCAVVPRIIPSLTARTHSTGTRPRWLQAVVSESYMIGVALAFLILGWRYNAFLLMRSVLIAFGISIVARAVLPPSPPSSSEKPAPVPPL